MEKFARSCTVAVLLSLSLWLTPVSVAMGAQSTSRVTVLYDAFGNPSKLVKDWGYAALVEYDGKRILFDTGNDAGILEHNVGQLGIDLKRLDAVIISHRHGDHTTGLTYLLKVNPGVVIYVPQEGSFFKARFPLGFLERDPTFRPISNTTKANNLSAGCQVPRGSRRTSRSWRRRPRSFPASSSSARSRTRRERRR